MSIARAAIHDHARRTRRPGAHNTDAYFQHHTLVLREILERLEIILEDEEVPEETIRRVIRGMLYGSPHASDAELREEQQQLLSTALQSQPPVVLVSTLDEDTRRLLGLPGE